MDTTKVRFLSV